MLAQSRDEMLEKARHRGADDFGAGLPLKRCPYSAYRFALAWFQGWQEAHDENQHLRSKGDSAFMRRAHVD
jgi:ribosome modulation factor